MVKFLSSNQELLTESILLSLLHLVRPGEVDDRYNLLIQVTVFSEPSHSTIRLLVRIGANPNVRIYSCRGLFGIGAGILHFLACKTVKSEDQSIETERNETALLMMELEANLDMVDVER